MTRSHKEPYLHCHVQTKETGKNSWNWCGKSHRANQLGRGYQPIEIIEAEEDEPEALEEREVRADQNTVDTKADSVITRGDNLLIIDLSKYYTDGK